MYLERNFDVSWGMFWGYVHSFINVETREVDFNNQRFIDFLNDSRELTSPDTGFGDFVWPLGRLATSPAEETAWSQRYFFHKHRLASHQYFLDFQEDLLFTGATPITDSYGRMLLGIYGLVLSVQATPIQQALAWELMRFMQSMDAPNVIGGWPLNNNVNREVQSMAISSLFRERMDIVTFQHGRRLVGTRPEAIESINAQVNAVREMPMTTVQVPWIIENIIRESLENFHFGLVSAEQTAQDLQNRLTLVMMEVE